MQFLYIVISAVVACPVVAGYLCIVGAKGSNITRLHEMTNANIHVGCEHSTIIVTGSFLFPLSLSVMKPANI
jgi:hypothetical protein